MEDLKVSHLQTLHRPIFPPHTLQEFYTEKAHETFLCNSIPYSICCPTLSIHRVYPGANISNSCSRSTLRFFQRLRLHRVGADHLARQRLAWSACPGWQ